MEIPSNSEICLLMTFLLKELEPKRSRADESSDFAKIFDKANDVRARLMNGIDTDVPPEWADWDICKTCYGSIFSAKLRPNESLNLIPKSMLIYSTASPHYENSVAVEFDNRRVTVGYGQSQKRWLHHDVVCGKPLTVMEEPLKPLWFATYGKVDKSESMERLRSLLD